MNPRDHQWLVLIRELALASSIALHYDRQPGLADSHVPFIGFAPDGSMNALCRFRKLVPVNINVYRDGSVSWNPESMFFTPQSRKALSELNRRLKAVGRDMGRVVS